jgi:hypothetical protein
MATAMEVASLLQRPRGIQDWLKEIEESMHVSLRLIWCPFSSLAFESLGGNSNPGADQPGFFEILSFSESSRELRSPIHCLFSVFGLIIKIFVIVVMQSNSAEQLAANKAGAAAGRKRMQISPH